MKMFHIHFRTEVGVKEVFKDKVELTTGEILPSKLPLCIGVDFVTKSPALNVTEAAYIPVTNDYRHVDYPNVWLAGVDVKLPFKLGKVPFSGYKTGYPSDETG